MQANYDNQNFDSTRLFAFLRGSADDILLVIVNFDRLDKECSVYIPKHAYTFLNKEVSSKSKLIPLLDNNDKEI